jgi:hypothetical protein
MLGELGPRWGPGWDELNEFRIGGVRPSSWMEAILLFCVSGQRER